MRVVICRQCQESFYRPIGEINRAAKRSAPLYCGKACSGLARRKAIDPDSKRQAKAEYDRRRREALGDDLLAKKRAAYHASVAADTEAVRLREKLNRVRRRHEHAAYCRRPEYRAWKSEYDRKYRAVKEYGPFSDAFLMLGDLHNEIASRATRNEIYAENGTVNKSLKRKREYGKAIGC